MKLTDRESRAKGKMHVRTVRIRRLEISAVKSLGSPKKNTILNPISVSIRIPKSFESDAATPIMRKSMLHCRNCTKAILLTFSFDTACLKPSGSWNVTWWYRLQIVLSVFHYWIAPWAWRWWWRSDVSAYWWPCTSRRSHPYLQCMFIIVVNIILVYK